MHDRVKQQLSDIISSVCVDDNSDLSEEVHSCVLEVCSETPDFILNLKSELSSDEVVIMSRWAAKLVSTIADDKNDGILDAAKGYGKI